MAKRRRQWQPAGMDHLFSAETDFDIQARLSGQAWPDQRRFPVNRADAHVKGTVREDLKASDRPLLITGYAAIAELLDFLSEWRVARGSRSGTVQILLGSEPFPSQRTHFMSADEEFTEEVRNYWLNEHSISVRLSAKVIRAIEELNHRTLQVRAVPGPTRLHAKVYIGDHAATVGSSNFTGFGLSRQLEANARFEKADDPSRYDELALVAENLWSSAHPWDDEFRQLLMNMLQVVSWQEALARACAELLEGDWARSVISSADKQANLWPSQKAGIAQSLWVVENLGGVLVADATGSGKTRMGAHLVAAVRNRLIDTGRLRRDRDLTTLVCPPAVRETWQREALASGVTIMPVSHGLLSQPDIAEPRTEVGQVTRAQVLAVDEAHNFLSAGSNRTRHILDSVADHVLLFTATPISRGTQDLLSLVGLLGADNFDDETLEILEQLDRGTRTSEALTDQERDQLRREIQRFTVRRTKSALNDLVARDEEAYRHPDTGRVCRYPVHNPRVYLTGEALSDESAANEIRSKADELKGIVQLGRSLRIPDRLRREFSDEQWLDNRLKAARGLARHHVLAAMRSSRAALVEHVAGTAVAIDVFGLTTAAKTQLTGDMHTKVASLADQGLPIVELHCKLPGWLSDEDAWRAACAEEAAVYQHILDWSAKISEARERTKAELLERLAADGQLVLAFDWHPITLAAIGDLMSGSATQVVIATGGKKAARKRVERLFSRESQANAIALCSDALNEGLNLQGAAQLVHLDLPTTLRVAEQRVGRVDRMDSPHDHITVWWPDDGKAFATRANEVLLRRREASENLLGSNLPMPSFAGHEVVPVREYIQEVERLDLTWDGINDALDPVHRLVTGEDALIPSDVYETYRQTRQRVMARVAPVASEDPWAFLALAGPQFGAPRWLMLETGLLQVTTGVEAVAERLRARLHENPPNVDFDETCERWLDRFLAAARKAEAQLLPRRMQRGLEQMAAMTEAWSHAAFGQGDYKVSDQWEHLRRIARLESDSDDQLDPYLLGEAWWDLVRPLFADIRKVRRRRRYTRLRDLDELLRREPLSLDAVHNRLRQVSVIEPLDMRVSAAIIGIPR